MSRKQFCEACNMMRNGVRTRIALEHTCGLERGELPDFETEKPESAYANPLILGGGALKKFKEIDESVKKPKPKPKPKPKY